VHGRLAPLSLEHEARRKLARARERIEAIVTEILGQRPE